MSDIKTEAESGHLHQPIITVADMDSPERCCASGTVALVVPGGHGAVLAELADGPLDDVALRVCGRVEGGWPSALAAAPQPVLHLVCRLGNGGLDPAAAQPGADRRSSSGPKASESWRCLALVSRASGRHPESASRWILLVSPPRDRPSASRSL